MTPSGYKPIRTIDVNDTIYDHKLREQRVIYVSHRKQKENEICYELLVIQNGTYGTIVTSENHRLLNELENQVKVNDIKVGDVLYPNTRVLQKRIVNVGSLTDITVTGDSTFALVPFDVVECELDQCQYLIHTDMYDYDIQNDKHVGNHYKTWL
jgi:ABC-type uncharacterized transport system ATPase subunit